MKIKMLETARLLGVWPEWAFYKGKVYNAAWATNQPNYKERLVFAEKKSGQSILLKIGKDCKIIQA